MPGFFQRPKIIEADMEWFRSALVDFTNSQENF